MTAKLPKNEVNIDKIHVHFFLTYSYHYIIINNTSYRYQLVWVPHETFVCKKQMVKKSAHKQYSRIASNEDNKVQSNPPPLDTVDPE